ncbi:unnamed protein product, partial [Brenthis ino]
MIWINTDVVGLFAWLIQSAYTGKSFIELTNVAPCLALCILGDIQAFFHMKHSRTTRKLIQSLCYLQSMSAENEKDKDDITFLKAQIKIFHIAVKSLTVIIVLGIAQFGINPFVITALHYHRTGEVVLSQPFIVLYPFDQTDIRYYFFVYVHTMWSAVIAVLTLLAPCFVCYACSTFIIYQFHLLKKNIEQIIPYKNTVHLKDDEFREEFMEIIERHRRLIQCVDLMEIVYTESTLCNVVTSSILICLTGFNVMSSKLSDAVYNSQWYGAEASIVKDLMIVAARARKPCKLTALRYTDINFKTFTKILSTSWSYFALLSSVYNREKNQENN